MKFSYDSYHSFVGLGAVVTKSVEENKVVAGVPARKIREVKREINSVCLISSYISGL